MEKRQPKGFWNIKQNCLDEAKKCLRKVDLKKTRTYFYTF